MDGNEVREYFVIVGTMKKKKIYCKKKERFWQNSELRLYTACPNQTSGIQRENQGILTPGKYPTK